GGGGKIINTASSAGKRGFEIPAHYPAAKFAGGGFTQAPPGGVAPHKGNGEAGCPRERQTGVQGRRPARGTKVRGRTPDAIKAQMTRSVPLRRLETPEDVAKVVVFLASEESDYMTGQAINVTGGLIKH